MYYHFGNGSFGIWNSNIQKIDGTKLKPAFGWFVLIMGIYIIVTELFFT
jgi:hypothetical protein